MISQEQHIELAELRLHQGTPPAPLPSDDLETDYENALKQFYSTD